MNVFVLCTGRSGSTTFYRACRHITNYSAGHELNTSEVGRARLDYPEDHIEVDNRLSWLLGRLDQAYGDRAFYVHLTREEEPTARSFDRRGRAGTPSSGRMRRGSFGERTRPRHSAGTWCEQ